MGSVAALLAWCQSQLGTVESGGPDGHSGNIVHYWGDVGLPSYQGQPWCDAFVSAAFLFCHVPVPVMAYVPASERWYQSRGWLVPPRQAQPGDQVFYGWGSPPPGHTGIVESVTSGGIVAIEGNTQVGEHGDQSNGGGVYRRARTWSVIRSVGRPPYTLTPAPAPPPVPVHRFTLEGEPVARMTVTIPTDSNGNGWLPAIQTIDETKMVAVTPQGSAPGRDGRYWPGSGHWQDDGGHPLVSITGSLPNVQMTTFVVYGE